MVCFRYGSNVYYKVFQLSNAIGIIHPGGPKALAVLVHRVPFIYRVNIKEIKQKKMSGVSVRFLLRIAYTDAT